MPKNRILYNSQALYIGPSPSTGYHFIDEAGLLNNTTSYEYANFNLIKKINRVTNFNYNITIPREEYKQLGKSKIADNTILNHPTVEVDFEYYLNGITNEARMGWNVNHEFKEEVRTGQYVFEDNFSVFVFSGLNTYDNNDRPEISPFWPGSNRSSKNLFLSVTHGENEDEVTKRLSVNEIFNRKANVVSFGDGYMTSYETSCSVGETPKAKVGFVCDNIIFYTGSSGIGIPAINPKTRENYDNIKFVLPEEPVVNDLSIVLPSEIFLDIQQTGNAGITNMNDITGFGVQFKDIKIQSYSIGIKFDRENMESIGFKAPANRRINFPVPINLSVSAMVGDESVATLIDQINQDDKYNITLRMKDRFSDQFLVRYDFRKAALQNYDYSSSIEQDRRLNLNFKVNVTPDDLTEGFFVSGQLTNIYTADLLLLEDDSGFVSFEDNDNIFLNLLPLY
jgi:hypothetical protein